MVLFYTLRILAKGEERMKARRLVVILSVCLSLAGSRSGAQGAMATKQPVADAKAIAASGIRELYQNAEGELLWYCPSCEAKRMALLDYISHSDTLGLQPAQYLIGSTKQYAMNPEPGSANLQKADQELSKIALRFSGDLYAGAELDRLVSYDEVSPPYAEADMAILVQAWSRVTNAGELVRMLQSLQPRTAAYRSFKRELQRLPASEVRKRSALLTAMNYYRWMHHFSLDSFIVVNIPAANLRFYKGSGIAMQMRTVVGTSESRTPRFASHITEISLYPYWNMPRSILMDEWFGLIKDNRAVLDYHELEIVDSRDSVVPYGSIKWKNMTSKNFPYRIRQKTGCANPLGVVKFGMSNPFDVYLHDTPGKGAFGGVHRYYSHGCVRVEDAIGLANAILPGKVDARYLNACFSDQKPQVLPVAAAVPVFIVYMIADVDDTGKVIYHRDIYELLGK
jgi:murein L,D-transpeptidase YcbB/YkuD